MKYSEALAILAESKLSPEQLAPLIGISNMTYRRWLKRENKDDELSLLHERGVQEAIRALCIKGLVLSEHTKAEANTDQTSLFESVSQTIDSLRVALPKSCGENDEAFLRDLLQQIGSCPGALSTIQESGHVFEAFKKTNNHMSSCIDFLLKATQAKGVPRLLKTIACGALLYFLTPVDMIPDFNFGVGFLDDYGVMAIAVAFCQKVEHRKRFEGGSDAGALPSM